MFRCFIHIQGRGRRGHDGMVVASTTICDKVCQLLATGRWFSPDPPASSTNITDRHDIAEICVKCNNCILFHISIETGLIGRHFNVFNRSISTGQCDK